MIIEVQINLQNVSGVFSSKDFSWAVRAHYCDCHQRMCLEADLRRCELLVVVAIPQSPTARAAIVCYTAVFSVVTQRSSQLTASENRTTFLSRD